MTEQRFEHLERSLEKAWDKIDELTEVVIKLEALHASQTEMLKTFNQNFADHMKKDEAELGKINTKIDALNQYKWIALGAVLALVAVTDKDVVGLIAKVLVGG